MYKAYRQKATKKFNNTAQFGWDSKFERGVGEDLELRKLAGEIVDIKRQVAIRLEVNGYLVATYKIDFIVEHNDGHLELIEAKGFATADWKLKWKLLEALHQDIYPGSELTIIYQRNTWSPRGSVANIQRR